MQANQIATQMRDAAAAVAELLDHGVEILSLHIGPAPLPATINVRPCPFVRRLLPTATHCALTSEFRVRFQHVELAWISSDFPPSGGGPLFGPLSGLNRCIRALDEELGRPA